MKVADLFEGEQSKLRRLFCYFKNKYSLFQNIIICLHSISDIFKAITIANLFVKDFLCQSVRIFLLIVIEYQELKKWSLQKPQALFLPKDHLVS